MASRWMRPRGPTGHAGAGEANTLTGDAPEAWIGMNGDRKETWGATGSSESDPRGVRAEQRDEGRITAMSWGEREKSAGWKNEVA